MQHFAYTPVLGWSFSRFDMFSTCKRKYYYHYYGKKDPELDKAKLNKLRSLTSAPLEIGTVVHECVAKLLKRLVKCPDNPIQVEQFYQYAKNKSNLALTRNNFSEAYYGIKNEIKLDDLNNDVILCLSNFLKSERYSWILKEAIKARDNWIIDPEGYGEIRVDGLKAYCKVDFLFPVNGDTNIIDWKTGRIKEQRHYQQLHGYASWAAYHYEKDISKIKTTVAYLQPEYIEKYVEINESNLMEFTSRVQNETKEMYSFCKVVEQDIPIERDKFLKTKYENNCQYCNYKEMCQS